MNGITRVMRGVAIAASLALLTGCGAGASPPGADGSPDTETSSAISAVVGTWGHTAEGSPNLTFTEDGTVSGSDGCNRLAGRWQEKDGVAVFEELATTLMECEGVDAWLAQGRSAVVEGDELVVSGETGATLGTLPRTDE